MKPKIFIGSSQENRDLAYAVHEALDDILEVTVWDQGVFELSEYTVTSLLNALDKSDFGLFIFSPDDLTTIRDTNLKTVRDNVIFELGICVGRLGRERSFLLVPKGISDLHLPTDLLGLTTALFNPVRQDGNVRAALGPACQRIITTAKKLGSLNKERLRTTSKSEASVRLTNDPTDCVMLIESWLGRRTTSQNLEPIEISQIDEELKLVPGSARRHIELAASKRGYKISQFGELYVQLKDSLYDEIPF